MAARAFAAIKMILWAVLAAYALLVARDFFRYADRLVYLAVDDGLANYAYVLATEGRYGFLASPTVMGIPRHHGEVSYGPWYFFLSGGLVWLFGYSLTLVRSVHLWVIVGTVLLGSAWFRGAHRIVAAAALGLAILYCFDAAMWPMARPDSMVSAFAMALVVCAGLGMTRDKAGYWFGAGLAASCGTFTHLIAWSLMPSSVLLFAVWSIGRLRPTFRDPGVRRSVAIAFGAFSIGGLLAATMFYGSFDFRFADQFRFFGAYNSLVESREGYWTVLARHFSTAFGYLWPWQQRGVLVMLAGAWITIGLVFRAGGETRRTVIAYLLPPTLVWSAYLLSSGVYTNYHKSYAILHQVAAAWTGAALIWSCLHLVEQRSVRFARTLSLALALILLVQGVRLIDGQLEQASVKDSRAQRWVSIADHTNRLLEAIPAGATAWGSVMYGIETPHRIQLVQTSEALILVPTAAPDRRPALAPDYLVWGYTEARDNMLIVLGGGDSLLARFARIFPDVPYRAASIVAASPYGVSRIYARTDGADQSHDRLPDVSVYDPDSGRWLTRLGPEMPVEFGATSPAEFRIGYAKDPPAAVADRTVTGTLPAGQYLLQVTIQSGKGPGRRRLLTATSTSQLTQTMGELGPQGDFSGYWPGQTTVMLLGAHEGGPLHISQFDDGAEARITRVRAFPVLGLLDPEEVTPLQFESLPPPRQWQSVAGTRATEIQSGALLVEGDQSANGYQILSPPVPASPSDRVSLQLDLSIGRGAVCTGVLNGTQADWIVAPDRLRLNIAFEMDRSAQFFVVVANCNQSLAPDASRFTLGPGGVRIRPASLYTDRFMDAVFGPGRQGVPRE